MRVLVVDDSRAVRTRLAALVREVRVTSVVHEAADGDEALAVAAEFPPEVVLLDVHMPRRTGLEVLPLLKAAPRPPLVVVLTNDASDALRRLCRALGADHCFDKSRDVDLVLEVVAAHRG